MISLLLLAAAGAGAGVTAPLAAQTWDAGQRADRMPGPDRRDDGRPDDPRSADHGGRGDDGERRDDRRDGDGRPDREPGGPGRGDGRYTGRDDDRDGRGGARGWRDGDGRGNRPGFAGRPGDDRGPDRRDGGWNGNWRGDRRYDWQGYRASNRGLYRAPRYYGPRGSDYTRWSRGYRVPPSYYGRTYWIDDPYRYRLPPAYGNHRWVRYYDDVALVDVTSGRVEDVIYAFFDR